MTQAKLFVKWTRRLSSSLPELSGSPGRGSPIALEAQVAQAQGQLQTLSEEKTRLEGDLAALREELAAKEKAQKDLSGKS